MTENENARCLLPLRFIESTEYYSVYRTADNDDVLIGHGPGLRIVVESSELALWDLWDDYTYRRHCYGYEFLNYLRTLVTYPRDIDDVDFCAECGRPEWRDNMPNGEACEPCYDEYPSCGYCGDSVRSTTTALGDEELCDDCRDNHYSYCEHCEGYYPDDYSDEHQHDGAGCCESPALEFRVRNDGAGMLSNDERATITLAAGVISQEGLSAIRRFLWGQELYGVAEGTDSLGDQWQTREGNYTKRLSRMAYKSHGVKLSADVLSRIGNIASDHSRSVDFAIEITRDLNLSAEDFYHDSSCWWGSYSASRCALKTNGGYGLRTFDDNENVSGRAWVMPLRSSSDKLAPTFNAETPDALVIFNGYGALSDYSAARIVAHMAGWTYRKVSFSCEPDVCERR